MQPEDLKDVFKLTIEGHCLSKAIIEDYCEVISKITNTDIEVIKMRIINKAEQERLRLKEKLNHSDTNKGFYT